MQKKTGSYPPVIVGWYQVSEEFFPDGIDIAIRDPRTNEVVAFKIDNDLAKLDRLYEYLENNQRVGVLTRLVEKKTS